MPKKIVTGAEALNALCNSACSAINRLSLHRVDREDALMLASQRLHLATKDHNVLPGKVLMQLIQH